MQAAPEEEELPQGKFWCLLGKSHLAGKTKTKQNKKKQGVYCLHVQDLV